MRLAHHLLRHPSGTYHFRLVVPRRFQEALGRRIVKKSLRAKDPAAARVGAYVLGAHYAQLMDGNAKQGEQGMAGKKWDDAAVAAVMGGVNARGVAKWEAEGPGWKIKTDGTPTDNAGGLEALRALLEAAQAAKARSVHMAELAAKPKGSRARGQQHRSSMCPPWVRQLPPTR